MDNRLCVQCETVNPEVTLALQLSGDIIFPTFVCLTFYYTSVRKHLTRDSIVPGNAVFSNGIF